MKNMAIAARILNTPLMVRPDYLNTVCRVMGDRWNLNLPDNEGIYEGNKIQKNTLLMDASGESVENSGEAETKSLMAVIPVMGSLAQRGGTLDSDSSVMRGYNNIKNDINAALHTDEIGGVMLRLDSPGGELAGNLDLSRWIKEIQEQTGKPVWGHVQDAAYSAAYSIGSACERLLVTRSGGAGSIGVVMAHADMSKRLEKDGIKVTYIHAGDHKVDGNPYQELPKEVREDFQKEINFHYGHFVELVAQNRGLSESEVRDTEARCFNSSDSVEKGLADGIASEDEAFAEFFEHIQPASSPLSTQTVEGNYMNENEIKAAATVEATAASNERWKAVMGHANASIDLDKTVKLIENEALSVDDIHGIMDMFSPESEPKLQVTEPDDIQAKIAAGVEKAMAGATETIKKLQLAASDTTSLETGICDAENELKDYDLGAADAERYNDGGIH